MREVKTRAGSYFRFLVQWVGNPDGENCWLNEDEFIEIDADKRQAAKMENHSKMSSL